jgi:NOL1/NOP2/sun family putative RNA methylase
MLPDIFLQRLEQIIPSKNLSDVQKTFEQESAFVVRVNTLKSSVAAVLKSLQTVGVTYRPCVCSKESFVIAKESVAQLRETELFIDGVLYKQGLSSIITSNLLTLDLEQQVLDLCAAPGSKTSHIAALMGNTGEIVAIEPVRKRFYRLKSVLELLSVKNVKVKCIDGRRFRTHQRFDNVLVDAPCSSEGRFKKEEEKSYQYWSLRKIKEMRTKQRGLLLNGFRHLKVGGTLVYSTCTFAPEENEGVVNWLLKKCSEQMEIEKVKIEGIKTYPSILEWRKKVFDERVIDCVRVLPTDEMDGFFMAKIIKTKDINL